MERRRQAVSVIFEETRMKIVIALTVLAASCFGVLAASAQTAQPAWTAQDQLDMCSVHFSEFDPKFESKMRVLAQLPATLPSSAERKISERGTSDEDASVLFIYHPDADEEPAHNAAQTVVVLQPQRGEARTIEFDAHAGRAEWLSEKLVFMKIWWGTLVSTDMIYDAENGRFIYREMVNIGYQWNPACYEADEARVL